MEANNTPKLTGHEAIAYAEANGLTLNKYADPIEDAREGLTPAEARKVAAEDPSLLWIAAPMTTLSVYRTIRNTNTRVADIFTIIPEREELAADGHDQMPVAAPATYEMAPDPGCLILEFGQPAAIALAPEAAAEYAAVANAHEPLPWMRMGLDKKLQAWREAGSHNRPRWEVR